MNTESSADQDIKKVVIKAPFFLKFIAFFIPAFIIFIFSSLSLLSLFPIPITPLIVFIIFIFLVAFLKICVPRTEIINNGTEIIIKRRRFSGSEYKIPLSSNPKLILFKSFLGLNLTPIVYVNWDNNSILLTSDLLGIFSGSVLQTESKIKKLSETIRIPYEWKNFSFPEAVAGDTINGKSHFILKYSIYYFVLFFIIACIIFLGLTYVSKKMNDSASLHPIIETALLSSCLKENNNYYPVQEDSSKYMSIVFIGKQACSLNSSETCCKMSWKDQDDVSSEVMANFLYKPNGDLSSSQGGDSFQISLGLISSPLLTKEEIEAKNNILNYSESMN